MIRSVAVLTALLALWSAADAFAPNARPIGGFSAQPGMRPWRYSDGPNPDGWWCRVPDCRTVDGAVLARRELRLMARLGARVVRLEFPWPLIEPRRGRFDWRRSDHLVALARRHGVRLVPVLVYTPGWAAPEEANPPSARDFGRFARAFAGRYGRAVDFYELWNEANHVRYWTGSRRDYVERVLVPGARAVRARDRGAKVILSGPTHVDAGWLNGIYADGGGNAFDVMAYHDYSGTRAAVDAAAAVRQVLVAHGQGSKPIWLGEFGTQAEGSKAALITAVLSERSPIAVALWYTLRDDHAMSCCPPRAVVSESFGLMTDRYAPKPVYEVMKRALAR
jgi:hypothetical protein